MNGDAILFLDFDGVLHPAMCLPDLLFHQVLLLAEWLLTEGREVDVVIASDWRVSHSLDQLRRFFPQAIRSRIVDALPAERDVDPMAWGDLPRLAPRQCLIEAWLQASGRAGPKWAALDDWAEGFLPNEPRLAWVSGHEGLAASHLVRVGEILGFGA